MGSKGWYHNASFHDIGSIEYLNDEEADRDNEFIHGPFNTFGECKRDAIAYFKTNIIYSKISIEKIKKMKMKEVKKA